MWRLLADGVVLVHLVFVLFALFGGLTVLRWPRMVWVHLPLMSWGAYVGFSGRICPLTPLENWLRQEGGEARYTTSFIEHYVMPVLYPSGLTPDLQTTLGAVVLAVNAGVYTAVWVRHKRRPRA